MSRTLLSCRAVLALEREIASDVLVVPTTG